MGHMIAKDCSGIEIAKKKYQCYDCKRDILQGERYLRYKVVGKEKIRCLKCRQKIFDSL